MPFTPLPPHRLPRLAALLAFLGCAALVGFAQPPMEQEEPGGKLNIKKRIVVDDEPGGGGRGPLAPAGNPPDVKLDELVRAANQTQNAALKTLFAKYAVPFDRIGEAGSSLNVKPIPFRRAEWKGLKEFDVVPLDASGKPRAERRITAANVRNLEHFETLGAQRGQ